MPHLGEPRQGIVTDCQSDKHILAVRDVRFAVCVTLDLVEHGVEVGNPTSRAIHGILTIPHWKHIVLQCDLDLIRGNQVHTLHGKERVLYRCHVQLSNGFCAINWTHDTNRRFATLIEGDESRLVLVRQKGAHKDTLHDDRLTRSNIDTTHVVLSISHVIGWLGPLLETIQQARQESRGGFPPPPLGLSVD